MGKRKDNEIRKKYTKEEIINDIKRFVSEFGRVPTSKDFEKLEGYPSRKTITNIFGNFNDAIRASGFIPVGINFRDNKIKYNKEYLLNKISEYIDVYGKVPTLKNMSDFLGYECKIYYTKTFGSWNNALKELGLPLNSVSQYNDEYLKEAFRRFVSEHGRVPTWRDFNKNKDYPSFWCYQNRFGSWNNALRYYGYPTLEDVYNFEVISKNLLLLCNEIYSKEKRDIISVSDIESCEYLPRYCCLKRHFDKNNISIKEFLNKNGFDINECGIGMKHIFDDGELTQSKYEYNFSLYLRNVLNLKYNIDYFRNVKYKDFILNYNGYFNCDYLINYKNRKIYIEIAGMLNDYKMHYHENKTINAKRKELYRLNLMEKESMLKENNLDYFILFPEDININFLNVVFGKEVIKSA